MLTQVQFHGPFYVVTDRDLRLALPPSYIEAVNKEPLLSFQAFLEDVSDDLAASKALIAAHTLVVRTCCHIYLNSLSSKAHRGLFSKMLSGLR